jgi:BirA family transcriptional regulator, biotin operon repressor / biotin---[acetyl-CoA-carboxylase] ligase
LVFIPFGVTIGDISAVLMDVVMSELSQTAVLAALQTKWLGRNCYYEPVVGSTNELLQRAVVGGTAVSSPDGTLYLTDYQSAGRGRLQRQWQAPPGTCLLLSLLLRPNWPAEQANWLTMLTALAAAEALEAAAGLPIHLKWPNDLMLYHHRAWRKVGGILLEGNLDESGRLGSAVVGLGLNVNIPPGQLPEASTPATSLLAATGQEIDRLRLLADLLLRLEGYYETAVAGQSPQPAWNERVLTLGQAVRVTQRSGDVTTVIEGTAEATDQWGSLLVRDASGKLHTISAGDVTLR